MLFRLVHGVFLLLAVGVVQALSAGYASVQPRNGDPDTIDHIRRALNAAGDRTYLMNQTSISQSWSDSILFSFGTSTTEAVGPGNGSLQLQGGLVVICTTCYVKGAIGGSLTVGSGFNLTEIVDSVENEVGNITSEAFDVLEEYIHEVTTDILQLQLDEIPAWPTLDIDLDLDNVTGFPDVHAQFEFNDLEMYIELEVQLSAGATYTLNLFTSETAAGISIPGLEAGAVFSVSLVLIAEAEIDISSGIHIKLDDGLLLDLELFNKNVSGITLPGATMEFLPVTIQGHGSLRALLQLEASVGFQASENALGVLSLNAGIGGELFAYVADFLLQVNGSSSDDCELAAVAEYTLAVGGAAGATVAVDTYQWGPAPSTTIPVWYTTLASICAGTRATASPTVTARAVVDDRDDLIETTVSTTSTYTIVNCLSSGLINCPVRLQNTTSVKSALTTVLTVESGVDATYPAGTFTAVTSLVSFGAMAQTVAATTGSPTSYVPPSAAVTSHSNVEDNSDGNTSGGSHHTGLIIGLSVGLGLPVVAAAVGALGWYILKRKKYSPVPHPDRVENVNSSSISAVKQPYSTVVST